MKKILFLLLSTIAMYGQVPADATQLENIQITNNAEDLTSEKVNVQSANGVLNWQLINDFQNNKPYFSTGLLKNGLLTINADNTRFDLSAGIGVYSDFSDPENVTSKVFNFPAFNAVSSPYLATSNITYVAVNYNGGSPTIVMQASKFSNTQLRDLVVVGAVVHSNFATINTINNISSPSNDVGNSVADLFNFLGAKNQEGNVYSANGANLQLNKSAGVMFKYGANFHVNAKNPHNVSLPEQLSLTFRYRLRGGFEGTDRINIDTDNYDLNNVLTTVPPAKPYQIQTIFIPQTGQTRLQYGQDTYSTLADAIAAINTRKFVTETNLASQFVKVAYLVVKKGATSLNVAADADIRQATQFDGTASGGVALTYQSIIDALGYVPENVVNKVTDISTGANNTTYPTSLAVKTYADNLVVGMLNDRGSWDASVNLFPTAGGSGAAGAIRKGDMWYVSVAGTLGGKSVNVGDSFRALVNSPAQTSSNWSVLEANIGYVPANDLDVVHKTGNESIAGVKNFSDSTLYSGVAITTSPSAAALGRLGNDIAVGSTGSAFFAKFATNILSATQTYTFPNKTGVFAMISDLSAYEPTISPKNTGFNKPFGTTAGTVAEGNDSRILNGQTAFGWGNHAGLYTLRFNTPLLDPNTQFTSSSARFDANINNPTTQIHAISTFGNDSNVVAQNAVRFGASTLYTRSYSTAGGWTTWNRSWGSDDFSQTNINNWNTAFSWGNYASQNYFKSSYLKSTAVTETGNDANTISPNGGYITSYSATSWLANGGINTFGGLISFRDNSLINSLQLQYGNGHLGNESLSSIYFRTQHNSGYSNWKKLWSSYDFSQTNITNWNTAFSWGNHAGLYLPLSGGVVSGTITASPATVDTELATLGQAKAVARPYKVYTALLSQSGTDAPVATVLESTLGGTVVWSRNIAGDYSGALTGAFVNNKTTIDISSGINTSSYSRTCEVISSSEVKVYTYQGGVNTDGLMGNNYTSIEIRVYN